MEKVKEQHDSFAGIIQIKFDRMISERQLIKPAASPVCVVFLSRKPGGWMQQSVETSNTGFMRCNHTVTSITDQSFANRHLCSCVGVERCTWTFGLFVSFKTLET